MAFKFSTPPAYQPGDIFLGRGDDGREVGITTRRHAITIAGSGSGKGAALIIPNLHRWEGNALVIDPKGDNAEKTWQAREAMGQKVYVLDPFREAKKVPDRLRASCNLLDSIKPDSPTAREDIRTIADGMVIRYKADDGTWDNGSLSVIAGLIAEVLEDESSPEEKHLPAIRQLLTLSPDAKKLLFEQMATRRGFGNLAKAAAAVGLSTSKKAQSFIEGAVDHTEWLDSAPFAEMLSKSTFKLSELKTGNATVFLVLPPKYIADHGRFLRLFVRAALNEMMTSRAGRPCLMILDEFFSLGHIDQIAKVPGLMREYRLHLWPFLQDLGQLTKLYGEDGAHTFFANSDAHIFFDNIDEPSLRYVSNRIGRTTPEDINALPPTVEPVKTTYVPAGWSYLRDPDYAAWNDPNRVTREDENRRRERQAAEDTMQREISTADENRRREKAAQETNARAEYEHKMRGIGLPRLSPEDIQSLTSKPSGAEGVAPSMIVFAKEGAIYNLKLAPYFEKAAPKPATPRPAAPAFAALTDIPGFKSSIITDNRIAIRVYRSDNWQGKYGDDFCVFPIEWFVNKIRHYEWLKSDYENTAKKHAFYGVLLSKYRDSAEGYRQMMAGCDKEIQLLQAALAAINAKKMGYAVATSSGGPFHAEPVPGPFREAAARATVR